MSIGCSLGTKLAKEGKMAKQPIGKESDIDSRIDDICPVFEEQVSNSSHELPWSCGMSVNLHLKGVLPAELVRLTDQG